ncbi:MAG: hypothetical protein L6R36_000186 [Xanthoria steineri]|nr:MAG: hypothetical protein L6R36_000186 [Xanthoria steineri]
MSIQILTCVNETAGLITDPNNLYQICGVLYRTQTAVCEAALCSDADRQKSQLLGQQICRPFYQNNAAIGSSVVASIASATPIAQAAVAGKDATDQSNWPQCAWDQYAYGCSVEYFNEFVSGFTFAISVYWSGFQNRLWRNALDRDCHGAAHDGHTTVNPLQKNLDIPKVEYVPRSLSPGVNINEHQNRAVIAGRVI